MAIRCMSATLDIKAFVELHAAWTMMKYKQCQMKYCIWYTVGLGDIGNTTLQLLQQNHCD